MIHTRRQIDLDNLWANIAEGKYAKVIGPARVHVGPGIESMSLGTGEVYERRSGEGWKPVPDLGDNSVDELSSLPLLRSQKAYWDAGRPDIIVSLKLPPELLNREDLLHLVRELDRRFMQLVDKVNFESKEKLVDYSSLSKPSVGQV